LKKRVDTNDYKDRYLKECHVTGTMAQKYAQVLNSAHH